MKKHIFGLAVFSFIVGAAAVVYGFLNVLFPVPNSNYVFAPEYIPAERTNCKMIRELEQSEVKSPVVTQAVFNLNTKRFYWNLVNSETADSIVLHFFISDEKGTRYIDSVSAKSLIGEGELNSSPSYMKLGKFVVQTNLYFIPEYARTSTFYDSYHKSPKIKFDVRNAVPVTIDYGK